jgi:mannose-6-phosphate isomerase
VVDRFKNFSNHQEASLLRELYRALLFCDPEILVQQSHCLYKRLHEKRGLLPEDEWVLRLEKSYPLGDVGIFSLYILNLVKLLPGEAVFLDSNIVHAYLCGDLAECMANSDNVVRAGLTAKPKDINTLLAMLRYQTYKPINIRPEETLQNNINIRNYRLPKGAAAEFAFTELKGGPGAITFDTSISPHLLFTLEGLGTLSSGAMASSLRPGSTVLVPYAAKQYTLSLAAGTRIFQISVPPKRCQSNN